MATATGAGSGGNFYVDINLPETPGSEMPIIPEREKNPAGEQDADLLREQTRTSDLLEAIYNSIKLNSKSNTEFQKDQEKYAGKEMNMMKAEATTPQDKKRTDKIQDYFQKKMVVADFFSKTTMALKNILKNLGGGLMEIFKALMILALLGPEFLEGIITFVMSTIMMVVEAFIKALPIVVDAIARWLPKIIGIIMDVIPRLWDALIQTFSKLGDNEALPKPLREFFKFLKLVAETIKDIVIWFSDNMWALKAILVLVAAAYVAFLVIQGLAIAAKIAEGIATLAALGPIGLFILALVAFALIVIGIIAIFIILWNWGDQIEEMFSKMSTKMKLLVGAIALAFLPLTLLILFIWDLIKIIKWFQSGKAGELWDSLVTSFQQKITSIILWFTLFQKRLKDWFFKKFITGILNWFDAMLKRVKDLLSSLIQSLSPSNILSSIGDAIKGTAKRIVDSIFGPGAFSELSSAFDKIIGFFKDFWKSIKDSAIGKAVRAVAASLGLSMEETKTVKGFKTEDEAGIANIVRGGPQAIEQKIQQLEQARSYHRNNDAEREAIEAQIKAYQYAKEHADLQRDANKLLEQLREGKQDSQSLTPLAPVR